MSDLNMIKIIGRWTITIELEYSDNDAPVALLHCHSAKLYSKRRAANIKKALEDEGS